MPANDRRYLPRHARPSGTRPHSPRTRYLLRPLARLRRRVARLLARAGVAGERYACVLVSAAVGARVRRGP